MKIKKTIGVISNILLSVLYVIYSWVVAVVGMMLLVILVFEAEWSASFVFLFTSSVLLTCTPLFCFLGILFSVRLRKKGYHGDSFQIQFLPFGTTFVAIVFAIFSMFFGSINA